MEISGMLCYIIDWSNKRCNSIGRDKGLKIRIVNKVRTLHIYIYIYTVKPLSAATSE